MLRLESSSRQNGKPRFPLPWSYLQTFRHGRILGNAFYQMHAHFEGKFGQNLASEEKRAAETKSQLLAQYSGCMSITDRNFKYS